ncbi:MAG: phosphoribosylanthranilate isomerase [Leptospiraceae bacterium]|nr:phosphoribosylanthranilate isomerase [Leptospiraceae bacterium]
MPLIKVCGNLYGMNAHMVASFEPDYMGWNFVPSSPRLVRPEVATRLIREIRIGHPAIEHIGIMGGMGLERMIRLLRQLGGPGLRRFALDGIQLIGSSLLIQQTRSVLRNMGIGIPIWPVLRVDGPVSDEDLRALGHCHLYLIDRKVGHALGGTGKQVDPSWLSKVRLPYLLAGGLNPDNSVQMLESTAAAGVDIASGLEAGQPGVKDRARMEDLFRRLGRLPS